MSERDDHSKIKCLNLQDLPEVSKACSRYLDSINVDLSEFHIVTLTLEREFKEKDPEELIIPKEIISANCKAVNDTLVKAIREINMDSKDPTASLHEFLNHHYPIFWNFAFILKKCNNINLKLEKNFVDHFKDIILGMLSKPNCLCFINIFYIFLNILYELVLCKSRKKNDHDLLGQVLSIIYVILGHVTSDRRYTALIGYIDCFEGDDKKVSLFASETTRTVSDLVYYLLLGFDMLGKKEPSLICDILKGSFASVFMHFLDIQDFTASVPSDATYLAIQKYLLSISIIQSMCTVPSKIDFTRNLIKSIKEKIKNIFFYTILAYSKFYFSVKSLNYDEDDGIIGRLYRSLFDIFTTIAINTDQEGFPVILFSVILQKDISKELLDKSPQIQAFTLQFLEKYLIILKKKKQEIRFENLKECKLIEILFSVPFFELVSFNELDQLNFSANANHIWNQIWTEHLYSNENLSWISKSIVDSLKFNQDNIGHLVKISNWIQGQIMNTQDLIEECISNGLLEVLIGVISLIKRTQKSSENIVNFFVLIKYLLTTLHDVELKNSGLLMDLILQDNFVSDPECSDLSMACLAHLLKFQNDSNYTKFNKLLKEVDSVSMKIKLLNSMQEILKDSSKKKQCQESFLKAETLSTLKEIITGKFEENEDIIILWVSILECVRFLIEDNPTCKKHLQDFDFSAVTNTIKSESYAKIRSEIYMKSIESLLYILFETNNIGKPQLRNVKTPEVIPLVIELLSDCDNLGTEKKDFEHIQLCLEHIQVCLDDCYNAAHFANSRTTDLLLDALERSSSTFLLSFIEKTLPLVICHHITPQELKKIIEIGRRSVKSREKQLILYKSLSNAIKNSCCSTEHYKFQANHTCAAPTRYFCFRESKSLLRCEVSANETLLPPKEFSIFFWIYPDSLDKDSTLANFLASNNSLFALSIYSQRVMVDYYQEKKIFTVISNETIHEKQWNLIGISLKSPSKLKFSSDKPEIEIFINTGKCKVEVQGKVTRPKENFSKLILGNSETAQNAFKGRIITFFITKKALTVNHFKEIFFLSFQYNLGFNPDGISTAEDIQNDQNSLRFIFENISFQWHPRGTYPEVPGIDKIEIRNECERFNGVSIIEAIAANGGLKIFLPLIKEWADSQKSIQGIIILLDVIADVCIAQNVEIVLDDDFFDLLIFVLEESIKKPNVQLVDALIKIVGHLEWNQNHHKQALKSLFLNKKLWHDLDEESSSHYTGTLSLNIRKYFKCEKETLYGIFDQLNTIQKSCDESFMEIWQNLIPEYIEYDNIDGILILVFSMQSTNIELFCKFIEMLSYKKFKRECYESMVNSMIFLLKGVHEVFAQSCILKFILKITDDQCEEISKDKKTLPGGKDEYEFINSLCSSIDKNLDQNVLPKTFAELLNFCKKATKILDKKYGDKLINFVNILTKRVKTCEEKKILCENLANEAQDKDFALLIFERENFPGWLVTLYTEIPDEMEKVALSVFRKAALVKNFNKLRTFLITISRDFIETGLTWSLSFYHQMMSDLDKLLFKSESFETTSGKSVAVNFLDYVGVLEDLLSSEYSGSSLIDLNIYIPLVDFILKLGIEMQLINSTYPPLPDMDFFLQDDLMCKESIIVPNDSVIYLREGGFLRLILKFIFLGLHIRQDERLINMLKMVLRGGVSTSTYLTVSTGQKSRWESRFTSAEKNTYFDFFRSHMLIERRGDMLSLDKFLAYYVIAECTEVLVADIHNPILNFLKDFIREGDVFADFQKNNRLTDQDITKFYDLLKRHKLEVYSTSRFRINRAERNLYINVLANYIENTHPPDCKNFINEVKEMFNRYKKAKDNETELLNLLTSNDWVIKVHFYFLALTSMKLNFFIEKAQISTNSICEPLVNDELEERVKRFIETKTIDFTKAKQIYEQKLDRTRRMAEKKYKSFCKGVENLKATLTGTATGKFRLKPTIDSMGRMPFVEKNNQIYEPPQLKTRMSILSPRHIKLPLMKNSREGSIDDILNALDSEGEESSQFDRIMQDAEIFKCERIKVSNSIFGFLEISQDYLLFISEGKEKPKEEFYVGSALEFTCLLKKCEKIWDPSDIAEVFPRRFIHRHTAFEIYLKNGKSIYFNLFNEELQKKAMDLMKMWQVKNVHVVADPKKILQKHKKNWQKGLISNLEYLLLLNKFASRSFNDISQYPVFPWILKNYSADELKIEDESFYRNLSYPIGAQGEEDRIEAKRKFSMFADEEVDSFHYGSHYSSAGIVLHYLVRIDPYTDLAKGLQGGNFDVADRLFYSIEASWESGQGTTGDVKELVPELFYLPEVLMNLNNEDMGMRQDMKTVDNVELPKWASTSTEFIIKHRKALESNYVSSHLNEWIDLIFGYKQKGQQAELGYNRFSSITYEDTFAALRKKLPDTESLQGYIEQIVHFGQTPIQLFKSAHPVKEIKGRYNDIFERCKLKDNQIDSEEIVNQEKILAVLSTAQAIWSIKAQKGYLYLCRETSPDNKVICRLEGACDMKLDEWEEAVQWKYTFHTSSNKVLERNDQQYCLWGDEALVSGFHIDNSFKIHTLKGQLIKSVHHHAGLVTCVTSTQGLLFTGSMDTSIAAWENITTSKKVKPFNLYLGHSEAIRQLAVQKNYDMLLSLSINGIVLMHTIRSAQCLRKLSLIKPIRLISISEYGLVAIYSSGFGITIYTLNGTEVNFYSHTEPIRCMKFSESGDFLLYGCGNTFRFVEIIGDKFQYEKVIGEDRVVQKSCVIDTFCTSYNKEFFTVISNCSEGESTVLTLGKIREKKVLRPI
ncbi:hypothetical protein SteCoe_23556 [Stentor coeruleus]|uniref:BEACH domain-containing protein n=1 Tax=Stentor coeruleus TaxID=5963 RepID=A0A1R2BJM5_9CILI|nr:hypothetical protein SteCoe_23556 [Stentor coeruleus]